MAQIARSEISLAEVAGSFSEGVLAFDCFDQESGTWRLETVLVRDTLPVLEGTSPSFAHRIRVEIGFEFGCNAPDSGLRGPLFVAVERKWAVEPFSLEIRSTVNDSGGQSVSSGVDLDTIASAVAVPCFVKSSAPVRPSNSVEEHPLELPAGVQLHAGSQWLEVSFQDCGSTECVVRREFLESSEGSYGSKRTVHVKGSR